MSRGIEYVMRHRSRSGLAFTLNCIKVVPAGFPEASPVAAAVRIERSVVGYFCNTTKDAVCVRFSHLLTANANFATPLARIAVIWAGRPTGWFGALLFQDGFRAAIFSVARRAPGDEPKQ